MQYERYATGDTPALIVYLIDISSSMEEELSQGVKKIDAVHQAIDRVVKRMVRRSMKGEEISRRYRLAMLAYEDNKIDVFNGVQFIGDVVKNKAPRFQPAGRTNTAAAFTWARDLIERELPQMKHCPPPIICHLTDGQFNEGSDPEPIAREIMNMGNDDGKVLIENIYFGPSAAAGYSASDPKNWTGIKDAASLSDPYAQALVRMSSPFPDRYMEVISEDKYKVAAGSAMFIPASNEGLLELAFVMSNTTPIQPSASLIA